MQATPATRGSILCDEGSAAELVVDRQAGRINDEALAFRDRRRREGSHRVNARDRRAPKVDVKVFDADVPVPEGFREAGAGAPTHPRLGRSPGEVDATAAEATRGT